MGVARSRATAQLGEASSQLQKTPLPRFYTCLLLSVGQADQPTRGLSHTQAVITSQRNTWPLGSWRQDWAGVPLPCLPARHLSLHKDPAPMLWQGSLGLLENVSATDAGGDLLSQWSFAPDTA